MRAKSPVIPKITSRSDGWLSSSAKTAPPESHPIGSLETHYPRPADSTLDTARQGRQPDRGAA
ncbi:hypothetical protein MOKP44_26190 [Mycobacterium avium subsp. hominissuis]